MEVIDFQEFAQEQYLAYGMATLLDRAIPDLRDGLKPVQRRILYTLYQNRLTPEARAVKCARIVGDAMGKYHPHGDQSIYDALVRMAQTFNLRYPLVLGQGNFGRRDGDSQAAMRYTECKLAPCAEILLAELDQGAAEFRANYDDSLEEPVFLPAALPHILLNPVSGIAVGMATEIPPHNLGEVAEAVCWLLRHPEADLDAILKHLPGPDYPCGGRIVSTPEELRRLYETGQGVVRLEASWHVERGQRGRWWLVVDELPQPTSARAVLEQIERWVSGETKTKQARLVRQTLLDSLAAMRDESDREGLRLVFEPVSRHQDPEQLMTLLMSVTDMACTAPVNLVVLDLEGRPRRCGLVDLLKQWCHFRIETVRRRIRHRLDRVETRLHILEGRRIAFVHLDAVIAVIREAEDPEAVLMARFGFSQAQVADVLSIRLRQLARLEQVAIEEEMAALERERETLTTLLSDENRLRRQIVREIRQLKKRFGDARRTRITPKAPSVKNDTPVVRRSEPVTVYVSRLGWIKSVRNHGAAPKWKADDDTLVSVMTTSDATLALIDDDGRLYNVDVMALPSGKAAPAPVTRWVALPDGRKIVAAFDPRSAERWLVASSAGYGFVAPASACLTRHRAGKAFLTVPAGATPLIPVPVTSERIRLEWAGKRMILEVADIKTMTKGKGIRLGNFA